MFTKGKVEGRGITPTDRVETDVNDFYLATSRDGLNWDLSWIQARTPFLERGPAGSFDQNGVWPPSSPLLTINDKHRIYYCGRWPRHTAYTPGQPMDGKKLDPPKPRSAIGATEIRLDGLIYRETEGSAASITTKSFILEGTGLEVNCDAREGELAVEILDKDGAPMPGFSAADADATREDQCHHVASWKGSADLSSLKGQTIRLRFAMSGKVRLYAFQIRAPAQGPRKP